MPAKPAIEPPAARPLEARKPRFILALVFALLATGAAQSAGIHKWIDDEGVTHYSDEPPQAPGISVTLLEIDTGGASQAAPAVGPDNYYSIANQWQRMQRERLQRQQLELQRAALGAARQPAVEAPPDYDESDDPRYVVAYPRRYPRRFWHRRHHKPHSLYSTPAPQTGTVQGGSAASLGAFPTTN